MASISGVNNSKVSNLQGYGGLASGLDRDTLIEDMTYGTTSRIEKQKQAKTRIEWQQNAMRKITDMMIDFANKYTATMTSPTNLFNSSFWGKANASALGANSKCVSVTGRLSAAKDLSILGVNQLAQKAKWSSGQTVETKFSTGNIDTAANFHLTSELAGKTLNIKLGDKDYTVTLSKDGDYSDAANAAKSIQKALADTAAGGSQELADALTVSAANGEITFAAGSGAAGKELKITGGDALASLGFDSAPTEDIAKENVKGKNTVVGFDEWIAGKEMVFQYNGKNATIKMPTKDELSNAGDKLQLIRDSMQKQLDAAYGTGRVKVEAKDGKLSYQTTKPDGTADSTSVLSVVSGDSRLVGKDSALGIVAGATNRVNMNEKVGLTGTFTLNGTEIELTAEDTYASLMSKMNEKTNVQITYQAATGQFTLTSKEEGASGKIEFGGALAQDLKTKLNLDDSKNQAGQDAIINVKYANGDAFEITRGSNTFDMDGLSVTVKDTFGYDASGNVDATAEAVTFDVAADSDSIVKGIKDMVDQYNEILTLVNKELSTRPDRDYAPLTSAQKKELDDEEAKLYEEKAKEGILFGDSDLRSLSSDLRFIMNPADLAEYEKIGLSVSSSYADNGKLVLDEEKLRAALAEDPAKVQEIFTKKKETDPSGRDGIAENMTNVMEKYVKTLGATKGILIEKAGSTKVPTSVTKNALHKQLQAIDEKIDALERRLKMEQDRYIKQFTSLESIISQMNAQSGWLSQFGGY